MENKTTIEIASYESTTTAPEPTQHTIQKIGFADLAIFLVFFSGALGSTVGGFYAKKYEKKKEIINKEQ